MKPKLCRTHLGGVPTYLHGKAWRSPGCPVCDDKVARGVVTADAPTPEAVYALQHRHLLDKQWRLAQKKKRAAKVIQPWRP